MDASGSIRLYLEFEELCAELFRDLGYDVLRSYVEPALGLGPRVEWDIFASRHSERVYAEVKLVRRYQAPLERLRNFASKISQGTHYRSLRPTSAGRTIPLLIIDAIAEESHVKWIRAEFGVTVWDRKQVTAQARTASEELAQRFETFFAGSPRRDPISQSESGPGAAEATVLADEAAAAVVESGPAGRARELTERLANTKPGKVQAKHYEALCKDVIDYLFGDDLVDPRTQRHTRDGVDIFDITYRVGSSHPFWGTLTRDFLSRIILFECKNYSKSIGAQQIFSTERYLSASALRTTCFILSRRAPSKHAESAAFGAIRESGKWFVFLDDNDLKTMMELRESQLRIAEGDSADFYANDPTVYLDQKIYDFLSALPR